ncbi:MAG: transcription-repair coupling factor [Planctomycetota bacterium]
MVPQAPAPAAPALGEVVAALRRDLDPAAVMRVLDKHREACLTRLGGSAPACALAILLGHNTAAGEPGTVIVTSTLNAAEDLIDDIEAFGCTGVRLFRPWDTDSDGRYTAGRGVAAGNLPLLKALAAGAFAPVIIPVSALLQTMPPLAAVGRHEFTVSRGQELAPAALVKELAAHRFERADIVEDRGQFAVRGGIVDVYPLEAERPFRIEFFGDTVDSIRTFGVTTQASTGTIEACEISRISGGELEAGLNGPSGADMSAYLAKAGLVIMVETPRIRMSSREYTEACAPTDTRCVTLDTVLNALAGARRLHVTDLPAGDMTDIALPIALPAADLFSPQGQPLTKLVELAAAGRVLVCCQNAAEHRRLTRLVEKEPGAEAANLALLHARLSAGFHMPSRGLTVVTTREIFNRYRSRRRIRHEVNAAEYQPVAGFYALTPGDYIVHLYHGIGKFTGMKTLAPTGMQEEFFTIEYADGVLVYVPVRNMNLLQKYIGGRRERPELDRVGGHRWEERKQRARHAVAGIAADLLANQAARLGGSGIAFPADGDWQHEFEASFIYEDTPDQVEALAAIKKDMESARPMDRLLCGDVGFGKTELAVRAAFKAAMAGKQTAILVPTTILAQQHYNTFRERMADYPVTVDFLSRFKHPGAQKAVVARLKTGEVDIVIGTHRLLSSDIGFKDLGLLIIDEEQRFGVDHKERLKRFRQTVDVLTLTATPIPRTLHMALLGIKDISSLRTPPEERKPILTKVAAASDRIVSHAIHAELARGGQVFFVHNRVENIERFLDYIRKLAPAARLARVHGQMPEDEIEDEMRRFLDRETDVLVCTTIIESGIDLPNVNTLIINNAHYFGLADLHQLRGRVGRFTRQAYAYLLIPAGGEITAEAGKRLKTIERYAELGAGFEIALQDLEIRGAGNMLGAEQSGYIAAIGYDLYCRILESAVHTLRGEPAEDPFARGVDVDLPIPAFIPDDYMADFRPKLELYRRVTNARAGTDIDVIEAECRDRFGVPPQPLINLLKLQRIRIAAQAAGVRQVTLKDGRLRLESAGGRPPLAVDMPRARRDGAKLLETVLEYLSQMAAQADAIV